ncbi:hypothetical protein Tco_0614464, partial [Tanacetum coccineum]
IVDADRASHPPKKLREDHGTSSGTSVGGKSRSVVKRLIAVALLTAEVWVAAIPTLAFVTASVSTMPERESGDRTESVAELNLRTIGALRRSRVDDGRVCREMVDEFAPPKFFAFVRGMEHDQLFTEFNVGATRQMSLSAKIENLKAQLLLREAEAAEAIRLRAEASNFKVVEKSLRDETNALKERIAILKKEQNTLDVKVTELEASVVSKECELTDLNALLEKFQDDRMKVVNDKFDKLYSDFVEMTLHFEEKFYPHLLTTISRRRWLLTHGMELAIVNCLNSPEYLSALEVAIDKAIEKGMQDGLSARITHGKEGRVLTDVAAHNPSTKVDYIYALQQLQNVNFSLLAELKYSKDASVKTVMDILGLEGPLAEKLGLNELQSNVDQLMVPIHRSPDQVVVGATALSLSLDVSSVRIRKIRENIANQRSSLRDVFVPLADPFSAAVLTGTEVTSDIAAATADTNMALSTTFASASTIAPISVDDYEVIGADDQAVADENTASFPNVDDAELNIP